MVPFPPGTHIGAKMAPGGSTSGPIFVPEVRSGFIFGITNPGHPRQGVEAENTPNDDMKIQTLLRRVQLSMLHRTDVEAKGSPRVSKTCPKMLPKISSNKQKNTNKECLFGWGEAEERLSRRLGEAEVKLKRC